MESILDDFIVEMKNTNTLKLAWIGLHNVKRKSKSSKLVLGGLHKLKTYHKKWVNSDICGTYRKKTKIDRKKRQIYIEMCIKTVLFDTIELPNTERKI